MNIDYKELNMIKTKEDLYKGNKLKIPINKLINNTYYLHHVLINKGNIKIADDIDLPIYEFNSENMDGIMLAANNQDIDTLIYLLIKYKKYIYNTNDDGNNWIHFVEIDFLEKIIFNKKLEYIDWKRLLYLENNDNIDTISYIFGSDEKQLILNILEKYIYPDVNYKVNQHYISVLFENMVFSHNDIIKILKELIKNKIAFSRTSENIPPQQSLLLRENKKIVDILYQYKEDTNIGDYGFIYNSNGSHMLFYVYNKSLDDQFIEYLFFKFKKYLQLDELTINQDPLLFRILYYTINGWNENKIIDELFKSAIKNNHINMINDKKQSILHMLVQLPFDNYKQFHSKIDFKDINIRDNYGNLPIDYTNDKKWIEKLSKIREKKYKIEDNIKLINNKPAYSTLYKAFIEDIGLYFYFLSQKYSKLYIPNPKIHVLQNDLIYEGIDMPHPYLKKNHEFAWIINYDIRDDSTYIHPYLDMLLLSAEKSGRYSFAALLLSIITESNGLHATPIFIDLKKKQVIRWDSFGNSNTNIDNFIKTNLCDKLKYTYIPLQSSQNAIGIQEKTFENEMQNMKRGDFGGFCVAWTIWFIEHKIINNNIEIKKLINLLEKKIFSLNKPVNYIRNYSNYLFEGLIPIFKTNRWNLDEYTNSIYSISLEKEIFDFLMKSL